MNQRIFELLAQERQADMRRRAACREFRSPPAARRAGVSQSLRARTGWWLVDFGLKLAVRPDSRPAASPRPAGS
jgi:hypothetical protein